MRQRRTGWGAFPNEAKRVLTQIVAQHRHAERIRIRLKCAKNPLRQVYFDRRNEGGLQEREQAEREQAEREFEWARQQALIDQADERARQIEEKFREVARRREAGAHYERLLLFEAP